MTSPRAASRRPIVMLTHSYYEEDPRVRREAEALARTGRSVDVIALRRPGDLETEIVDGVSVRRLGVQRHQGAGLGTYLAEYLAFLARGGWALTRAYRRRRYGLVQVHTLPDFLVFAALPLRMMGVPVLLDLHEAMPEFYRSRFGHGRASRLAYQALRVQERLSTGFASAVVTVNEALGDRLLALGVPPSKLTIVPNAPALERFDPAIHPARSFMEDGSLRLVYAGALSPIYELDVLLHAIARLRTQIPGLPVCVELYGRDFEEVPLRHLAGELGLSERVTFHGRVPIDAVPAAIAAADIGVAPTRQTDFTDYSLSTKAFEYAAMGRPVVASRLPMVERAFGDDVVTYRPGDAEDLASAILRVVDDASERESRVARALDRVRGFGWEQASASYLALVERLELRDGRPGAAG